MLLRSRLIRLAHSMPRGTEQKALIAVLAANKVALKLAESMPLSKALQVLGIDSSASPQEAKGAYRALARIHHPDRGGETQKMQGIVAAYMVVEKAFDRNQMGGPTPPQSAPLKRDPASLYKSLQPTFKNLKEGDVVEVTYKVSASSVKKRRFVVEHRQNSGIFDHVYVYPARRRNLVGDIVDYGDTIYFQATLRQHIRPVLALLIVGQL